MELFRADNMKFILSNGEQLRENLQEFPVANELSRSKILVACVANNFDVIAACGIRSMFNVLVLHVKEGYRGRGIGMRTLGKTIDIARKQGLYFITLSMSSNNAPARHLYHKFGFKRIGHLVRTDLIVMILPLAFQGKLVHSLLLMACSAVPKLFLSYIHEWLFKRTVSNN